MSAWHEGAMHTEANSAPQASYNQDIARFLLEHKTAIDVLRNEITVLRLTVDDLKKRDTVFEWIREVHPEVLVEHAAVERSYKELVAEENSTILVTAARP